MEGTFYLAAISVFLDLHRTPALSRMLGPAVHLQAPNLLLTKTSQNLLLGALAHSSICVEKGESFTGQIVGPSSPFLDVPASECSIWPRCW